MSLTISGGEGRGKEADDEIVVGSPDESRRGAADCRWVSEP